MGEPSFFKLLRAFTRPAATPPDGAKLVTIAFSHYVEKARWGLDLSPLRDRYVEDAHMPVFHAPYVMAISKDRKKTGTPLLLLPDGEVVHDSTLILQHLCRAYPQEMGHLYPPGLEEEVRRHWRVSAVPCVQHTPFEPPPPLFRFQPQVKALEHEFDEKLGVASRRVAYFGMAQARAEGVSTANPALFDTATHVIPRVEAWLWWLMERGILPRMLEFMDITEATAATALEDCRAVFQRASALLAEPGPDGRSPRRYLLGTEKITAADITFAALAYPLLGPPQFASLVGGSRVRAYRCMVDPL